MGHFQSSCLGQHCFFMWTPHMHNVKDYTYVCTCCHHFVVECDVLYSGTSIQVHHRSYLPTKDTF